MSNISSLVVRGELEGYRIRPSTLLQANEITSIAISTNHKQADYSKLAEISLEGSNFQSSSSPMHCYTLLIFEMA